MLDIEDVRQDMLDRLSDVREYLHDRITDLENEVAALKQRVEKLEHELDVPRDGEDST